MGYPSGIPTFTVKSAGQTIQPAHVNDLQTEVTALATDLINGMTGPFIANAGFKSSNSTVGALHVAGDSTFASSTMAISTQTYIWPSSRATAGDVLTVASTSGSTATLQWQPTQTRPVCLVRHSAVTELAQNVWTGLNWDTEDADANGMHSTSANSSRITFAHSTGTYHVGLNVQFGPSAGSTFQHIGMIRLNDTIGVVAGHTFYPDGSAEEPLSINGLVQVGSTTDFVTARVFAGTGSTNRIQDSTASTISGPRFWAHKVG